MGGRASSREFDRPASSPSWIRTESRRARPASQEMAENAVDSAHFRYVHNTDDRARDRELRDRRRTARTCGRCSSSRRPRGVVDGRIDIDSRRARASASCASAASSTRCSIGCATPIDAKRTEVRFNFYVRKPRRRDDQLDRRQGVRQGGRQAVRGGQADLGAQGPPRAPGARRHRRPVHEVPQVVRAVLRRRRERRPDRVGPPAPPPGEQPVFVRPEATASRKYRTDG